VCVTICYSVCSSVCCTVLQRALLCADRTHRALLTKDRALLVKSRARLTKSRPLLRTYRSLLNNTGLLSWNRLTKHEYWSLDEYRALLRD